MISKLVEAQKWAMRLRGCISQVESFLNCNDKHIEKVCMHEVRDLLSFDPSPCLVPGHAKLKVDDPYSLDELFLSLKLKIFYCSLIICRHMLKMQKH